MRGLLFGIALLLAIQSLTCCKPKDDLQPPPQDTTILIETPADSNTYKSLQGQWRVDSAKDAQTGKVFSHLMDTVYGLNPATNSRIYAYLNVDTSFYVYPGYHWAVAGHYRVLSSIRIDFDVTLRHDRAPRPHRIWDSVVTAKFNEANMFFIKDTLQETQMTLTNGSLKNILYCTKI